MSKNKPTELICILDRSGSMATIRDDAQGGFNAFIDKRRQSGDFHVTLWQFDTVHDCVWPRQSLASDVPAAYALEPRGATALNDAIGYALTADSIKDIPKKANVIVIVVTDGQENSSHEYSRDQVRTMVKEREAEGWSFVFIGAGIDAFAESGSLGMSASSTLSSARTPTAVRTSYMVMDSAVETATLTRASVNFSQADRDKVDAAADDTP